MEALNDKEGEAEDDFTLDMINESLSCVSYFKDRFSGLDFTVESLEVVDNILEEISEFKEEMDPERIEVFVQKVASYVFEVARKNYGGKYYWYDRLDQPILVTGQPDFEVSLLAFEKVKGRIENGKEDNIPFFFDGYKERVEKAKPGDQAMIV